MRDSEKILLKHLEQTSKKADRYTFALIMANLWVFISIINNQHVLVNIPIINIPIENPIYFHLVNSVVLFSLFGITGSNILNYMLKRYAFDEVIYALSEKKKKEKYELVIANVYEFIYDKFIGKEITFKRFPDISRRITVFAFFLLLGISNVLVLINVYYMGKFMDTLNNTGFTWQVVFILLFSGFLFFFWLSFFQSIQKRVKRVQQMKIDLIKKQHEAKLVNQQA